MDVKVGVRIRPTFKIYAAAALLCQYTWQGRSKITNTCSAACAHSNVVLIQFNIHFSRIILTAKFHSIHVH